MNIMAVPELVEKLTEQGREPFGAGPEEFGALMKADREMFRKVIKTAGINLGN